MTGDAAGDRHRTDGTSRRRARTPAQPAPPDSRTIRPRHAPTRGQAPPAGDRLGRDPDSETARPPDELDALQAVWARHRDPTTGLSQIAPRDSAFTDMLTNGTWTHPSINLAIDRLASDGILERIQASTSPNDVRGHVRLLRVLDPLRDLPGTTQLDADGPQAPGRPCYVVSLFDASGTARYAVGDAFRMLGQSDSYQDSRLVEIDQSMAQRVQQYWATADAQRTDGGPPHKILANDVWDLFQMRQDGTTIWSEFLASLPDDSLVLIVGGSPCNNLSRISANRGVDGLAGTQSCHFFAIPFAAYIANFLRPGLHVQTLVENVHPMDAVSYQAMLESLGNLPDEYAVLMNAADWVASPRQRTWIGSFPPPRAADRITYRRMASPWEPRWAYRWDGKVPTWTRSRGNGNDIEPSSYQTSLRHLLFSEDSNNRWFLYSEHELKQKVHAILVDTDAETSWPGVREGLSLVSAGRERESHAAEQAVRTWAGWLMANGRLHGLRPPSEHERARAVGLASYYARLDLTGRDLYDAVGMHFDPRCLQQRIISLLKDWFRGVNPAPVAYPQPTDLLRIFDRVAAHARRHCPYTALASGPFRHDIHHQLVQAGQVPALPLRP